MHYNATSTNELVTGWTEIARIAGMAGVPEKKVRSIAARDSWPVYRTGYTYVACPADLIAHIRQLAKARAAEGRPPVDAVRQLLAESA
jgi:hypothetical protein